MSPLVGETDCHGNPLETDIRSVGRAERHGVRGEMLTPTPREKTSDGARQSVALSFLNF